MICEFSLYRTFFPETFGCINIEMLNMRYKFAMKKNMITFAQNGFFIVTTIKQ